jgi:hypothetical protein
MNFSRGAFLQNSSWSLLGSRAKPLIAGLLLIMSSAAAAQSPMLESGVAITSPAILKHLQQTRFSAGALLFPRRAGASSMRNDNLFQGQLQSIGTQLIQDIATLPQKSRDRDTREFFKDPDSSANRFSAGLLNDRRSGFVLTGIVNRMDRAYRIVDGVSLQDTCGEVRFIYRFTYDVKVDDGREVASRLPFTMAIVLSARDPDEPLKCPEIAQRWLDIAKQPDDAALTRYLDSRNGPLAYLRPVQVDRIEINAQLFRVPASGKPRFGGNAEYLLRIFRRDAPSKPFKVAPLENQIDRDQLLSNHAKLAAFKTWLFSEASIKALDAGILDIPPQYLATQAVSVSPGGSSRSENQPFFGLLDDSDIDAALQRFAGGLKTIQSREGFVRRLNDLTCSGCHQIRAIAGFHFPGADPDGEAPSNAVHVPGSAHFMADMPRRREIIASFAANTTPDFSRGFSARPDARYKAALQGTQLFDGWGSVCYVGQDPTFKPWTCASNLTCKVLDDSSRNAGMGVCVSSGIARVGDPLEFGKVSYGAFGDDSYLRVEPPGPTDPDHYESPASPTDRNDYQVAHQGFRRKDLTGGFPGGNLFINGCSNLPGEAVCGRVAGPGFNACIAAGKPFTECLTHTQTAGLRACDRATPCREDYICTAPYPELGNTHGMGTCIPPYFMFQFRVDGHPASFAVQERDVTRGQQ